MKYVVWHKRDSRTYAWANSPSGRRYAKRRGCNAADRDLCWTKDKVPIVTHEGVGVHEFKDRPRPRRMKWLKVKKLRRRGPLSRRIHTAAWELVQGAEDGVTPFFDIKGGDDRTQNPEMYLALIIAARRLGVRLHLMSQPFGGDGIASLAAARQAADILGDPNLVHLTLLPRGPIKEQWWDIVDDIKGFQGRRPADKPLRVTGRVA